MCDGRSGSASGEGGSLARSSAIFLASMYSYSPTSPSTAHSSRFPVFPETFGPFGATASSLAGLGFGGVRGGAAVATPNFVLVGVARPVDAPGPDVSRPPRSASKSMRFVVLSVGTSVGAPAVDDAGVEPRVIAPTDLSVSTSEPGPVVCAGKDLTPSASAVCIGASRAFLGLLTRILRRGAVLPPVAGGAGAAWTSSMAPRDGPLRGPFQDCSAGAASDSRFGSPFVAFDRDDARVFRMVIQLVSSHLAYTPLATSQVL